MYRFFAVEGCKLRVGAYTSLNTLCTYLESDVSAEGQAERNFWVSSLVPAGFCMTDGGLNGMPTLSSWDCIPEFVEGATVCGQSIAGRSALPVYQTCLGLHTCALLPQVKSRVAVLNQRHPERTIWKESAICTKTWNSSVLQLIDVSLPA